MNDYNELVEYLRKMHNVMLHNDHVESGVPEENITDVDAIACKEAADAIEQLVRERNELLQDHAAVCFKAEEDIARIKMERDAAVADLHLVANNCFEDYVFSACICCKKNDTCNGQPATGCEFEWRGAQEVDDG